MHFHQQIHEYLLTYRKEYNPNFNFLVRQRTSIKDKKYPGGKFAHGLVFQGTENYCFVPLIDRSGGANATKSVGIHIKPYKENTFKAILEIVFPGIEDEGLISFYRTLASKFEGVRWDKKGTRAYLDICEFPENDPSMLYNWLDNYFSVIRNTALESDIENLLPSDEKFEKFQETLQKRLKEDFIPEEDSISNVSFHEIKNKFEHSVFENFIDYLRKIVDEFSLNKGDERLVYSVRNDRLNFTIGQRYCLNIYYEDSRGIYCAISKDKLNDTSKAYQGNSPQPYLTFFDDVRHLNQNWKSIKTALRDELNRTTKSSYRKYNDANFENYVFKSSTLNHSNENLMKPALNTILFGPPGTGKTYSTITQAIKIIDENFYDQNLNDRDAIVERYRELLITDWDDSKGQIAFCTFHQSFTYEDFVEGIKPKITHDKNVFYDIEGGIFKRICELAESSKSSSKVKTEGKINWSHKDFEIAALYKLSLGEANNPDDKEIYEFCRDNGYISIGFGGAVDYSGKSEAEIKKLCDDNFSKSSAGSQLSAFIHGLSTEDYVIVSKGNGFVRAIGKVIGEYEYHEDFPIEYNHFRKVEWIIIDEIIPIEEIYLKKLSQRTIYTLSPGLIRKDFFVKEESSLYDQGEIKPYFLIIDEINRGNLASIFGELITLIEPDKRSGAKEELKVILPYSKEEFSVPDNVYIIGTMNTADRSIEALDSALRRRFEFQEVLPDYKLIDTILNHKTFKGFKLSDILETINNRITVLIDRDHQIGHSYFLKLKDSKDLTKDLEALFVKNIIPLLQEYFFNDYVKIAMVIGEGFMDKHRYSHVKFAANEGDYESDYNDAVNYEIKKQVDIVEAIKALMNITDA